MESLYNIYLRFYVSALNDRDVIIQKGEQTTDRGWCASLLGVADAKQNCEPRNTIELLAKIDRMLEEPKVVSITAESAGADENE